MKQLFGTDGLRGHAGSFPLDIATVRTIGASLAKHLAAIHDRLPRLITGRDTRESGPWIESAFHDGATAAGALVESAGVITTPGVAYLAGHRGFDAGIVISASHNPYEDNGIKIFAPTGKKLDGEMERKIEIDIDNAGTARTETVTTGKEIGVDPEFARDYLSYLKEEFSKLDLSGVRIVLDCANGAASALAPELFRNFGADVRTINCAPNGRNINKDCGSLHLEGLKERVLEEKADLGVAFDGDADRALFIDENGCVIDGDATLWIMAKYLSGRGGLANRTVVATVMSNLGLELALRGLGISLVRTPVGDKYVLDQLLKDGSELGGEQSGHIIFSKRSLVGDGMVTALSLVEAVKAGGTSVSGAAAGFIKYPQVLLNVRVREKRPFDSINAIAEAAQNVEHELDGTGRLLLRYSGTENLARVMIEGKDQTGIESQAERLAAVIRAELG